MPIPAPVLVGRYFAFFDFLGQAVLCEDVHVNAQNEEGRFLGDEREQRLVGLGRPDWQNAWIVLEGF